MHHWEPHVIGFVLVSGSGEVLAEIAPKAEPVPGWYFLDWSWPTEAEAKAAVEDYFARRGRLG